MKKFAFVILFFVYTIQLFAADKYAIIIGIGNYPSKTGWSSISSLNDVPIIKNSLIKQGFSESNIRTVIDQQATKKGIVDALNDMLSKVKKGDIVVVHYSGHGQQIFDDNGDEVDGLDEAIVPIDAFVKYTSTYKGENHIRDDEIGNIIAKFRNKLGKDGQLLFLLDSCHSGSATRGGKVRGGMGALVPPDWKPNNNSSTTQASKGSGLLEKTSLVEDAAPFVMISGASADELNYEYNGMGSLTYAFTQAITDLGSDFTYRQLFSKIAANMNVISPKQRPTIEGDLDYKFFKGEYIQQQLYYDVVKVAQNLDVLTINAGQINRIFKNSTVLIMPAGSIKPDANKAIAKGKITNSRFSESIVSLDRKLKDTNEKNYWVFIDQPAYGDISSNVYFYPDVQDASLKTGIHDFLSKNQLGIVVKDSLDADILIRNAGDGYVMTAAKGGMELGNISNRSKNTTQEISDKIFNFAQGNFLKNLSIKNQEYEFEFKLVPIEYDSDEEIVGEEKSLTNYVDEDGVFKVKPSQDYVVLEVTNKSNKDLYISIVEINSLGQISPFFPNNNCNLSHADRKLPAGKTMRFKSCVYSFGPPYERLILKGFASDKPLNFQSTIATRGEASTSNPLEQFLQQSYAQSRGAEAQKVSGNLDGYSAEFVYEIINR